MSRCNNLRWKADNWEAGFIRYCNGDVLLALDTTTVDRDGVVNDIKFLDEITEVEKFIEEELPGFEIVPRDPETYKDWLAGDAVKDKDGYGAMVEARLGNVVFLSLQNGDSSCASEAYYTCEELFDKGYRLVLTDYERGIENAKNEQECPFKKGDRVLVRQTDDDPWKMRIFHFFRSGCPNEYWIFSAGAYRYNQCIPYNENTWQLLGTTDKYEEAKK